MGRFNEFEGKEPFVSCMDHTVSRETFDLFKVKDYDLLATSPQPEPTDLPKYYESDAYISHTDSKKGLLDRAYQFVRSFALKNKVSLIQKKKGRKGSLLDIGCGTGDFLLEASRNGWKVAGVEPNENARKLSIQKLDNNSIVIDEIQELVDTQKKFDVITMWHVLEHIPDLENYIQLLDELLEQDGLLIVAVPNFKSYDAKVYGAYWAAYDVPRHLWHFSKNSIEQLFAKYNFHLSEHLPMIFDSFYVSLLSEKYRSGKMNPVKAFLTGLRSNMKARRSGEYSSLIYLLKKA